MDYRLPGLSVHGDSLGKNTEVDCHALPPGGLPNPGIKPRYPTLQVTSLLSEPPGKQSCKWKEKGKTTSPIGKKKSPLKSEEEDFSAGSVVKNPPASAGDTDSLLGLGGSHMPQSNYSCSLVAPQLLSMCSRAWEKQLLKLKHSRAQCSSTRESTTMRSLRTTTRVDSALCN